MVWKDIKEETPHAYESGNWDGLKSDPVLAVDKNGKFHIAVVYEGHMDGSHFIDFYDTRDFELRDITHWCKIPMLF
jgi:hypothetical protein